MPKRAADSDPAPARRLISSAGGHPLFQTFPETNHRITDSGSSACKDDPDLSPGINCCALCAKTVDEKDYVRCTLCRTVIYCSPKCQGKDSVTHTRVCEMLALIAEAEAVEITPERELQLLEIFATTPEAIGHAQDWSDAIPDTYAGLLGAAPKNRHKRVRKEGAAAVEPTGSEPTSNGHGSGTGNSKDLGKAGPSEGATDTAGAGVDAVAKVVVPDETTLAAELAVCSSMLSYPYTLLRGLQQEGSLQAAVERVERARLRLVVTVLGASDTAELLHLEAWRALSGVAKYGVVVQFVGPEVPEELSRTSRDVAEGVQAVFYRGTYDQLVEDVTNANPPMIAALSLLPDVLVGYNLGLTCTDYDWDSTLMNITRVFKAKTKLTAKQKLGSQGLRLPLLLTCNTRMETTMEQQLLTARLWHEAKPATPNVFMCLEALQSGSLGNDLYRKNAWVSYYELVQATVVKQPHTLRTRVGGWVRKVVDHLPGMTPRKQLSKA